MVLTQLTDVDNHQTVRLHIDFRSALRSPTVITGGRADRRRKMEEKKENKTLENLRAERERKRNKAGKDSFYKLFLFDASKQWYFILPVSEVAYRYCKKS